MGFLAAQLQKYIENIGEYLSCYPQGRERDLIFPTEDSPFK